MTTAVRLGNVVFLTLAPVQEVKKPPLCSSMSDLFYGPDVDGRTEKGRAKREAKARSICLQCEYRMPCLERAMVLNEVEEGVWGGMGRAERRAFREHIKDEGYEDEVPSGMEFWATLNSFYRAVEERMQVNVAWSS